MHSLKCFRKSTCLRFYEVNWDGIRVRVHLLNCLHQSSFKNSCRPAFSLQDSNTKAGLKLTNAKLLLLVP